MARRRRKRPAARAAQPIGAALAGDAPLRAREVALLTALFALLALAVYAPTILGLVLLLAVVWLALIRAGERFS